MAWGRGSTIELQWTDRGQGKGVEMEMCGRGDIERGLQRVLTTAVCEVVPLGKLWALGRTSGLRSMRVVLTFTTMRGFQWNQFGACKRYGLSL